MEILARRRCLRSLNVFLAGWVLLTFVASWVVSVPVSLLLQPLSKVPGLPTWIVVTIQLLAAPTVAAGTLAYQWRKRGSLEPEPGQPSNPRRYWLGHTLLLVFNMIVFLSLISLLFGLAGIAGLAVITYASILAGPLGLAGSYLLWSSRLPPTVKSTTSLRSRRLTWLTVGLVALGVLALIASRYERKTWLEEARLANGDTMAIVRTEVCGPDQFFQPGQGPAVWIGIKGSYRGRYFRWSSHRNTDFGSPDVSRVEGPVTVEWVNDRPVLVFEVSGVNECKRFDYPDQPIRAVTRGSWGWSDFPISELPVGSRVNLLPTGYTPRPGDLTNGVLTAERKDGLVQRTQYEDAAHGALLSDVANRLNVDTYSCHSMRLLSSGPRLATRAYFEEAREHPIHVQAQLLARLDERTRVDLPRYRNERGGQSQYAFDRGCAQVGILIRPFGVWQQFPPSQSRAPIGGLLVGKLGEPGVTPEWVLPVDRERYLQISCDQDTIVTVQSVSGSKELLMMRFSEKQPKPIAQLVTVPIPIDLQSDQKLSLWQVAESGEVLEMAEYVGDYSGGVMKTFLRYRVPWPE